MDPHDDSLDLDRADEPAGPVEKPANLEAPEADAIEQVHEVTAEAHVGPVSRDLEVPEADAIEQATEVVGGADEEYAGE